MHASFNPEKAMTIEAMQEWAADEQKTADGLQTVISKVEAKNPDDGTRTQLTANIIDQLTVEMVKREMRSEYLVECIRVAQIMHQAGEL